ncbi:hypothetical protein V8E55_007965 [Tylopilus felleus]
MASHTTPSSGAALLCTSWKLKKAYCQGNISLANSSRGVKDRRRKKGLSGGSHQSYASQSVRLACIHGNQLGRFLSQAPAKPQSKPPGPLEKRTRAPKNAPQFLSSARTNMVKCGAREPCTCPSFLGSDECGPSNPMTFAFLAWQDPWSTGGTEQRKGDLEQITPAGVEPVETRVFLEGRGRQRPIKSNHSLPRFAAEEYGDLTGSGSPLRTHVKNTQMQ